MTSWLPRPESLARPAYRSLARAIEAAILSGALKPGERLPTQRRMAFDLGLSIQTVSRAYERLAAMGCVVGEVGRGTYVRALGDETRMPFVPRAAGGLIDMSLIKPVIEPAHEDAFAKTLRAVARALPEAVLSAFRPATILNGHAGAVAAWLRRCGVEAKVPSSRVVVTNGATAAMTVALMTVARPGDTVATEGIGHHTLRPLSRFVGFRLRGLEIDEEGVVPSALDAACRADRVHALYLMPDGLNPTAFTMSEARRRAVVEVARRHDVAIVENHAWGPLPEAPPPPLAALAPERALFCTGLTKCLLPGLRVGFLVVPEALGSAATDCHLVTNWMATNLTVEIAARWIEDGTADDLLTRQRAALSARARYAAKAFAGLEHRVGPNGLHAWLARAGVADEEALVEAARLAGVAVAPGARFAVGPHERNAGVRVAFGGQTFPSFARGVGIVAGLAGATPARFGPGSLARSG